MALNPPPLSDFTALAEKVYDAGRDHGRAIAVNEIAAALLTMWTTGAMASIQEQADWLARLVQEPNGCSRGAPLTEILQIWNGWFAILIAIGFVFGTYYFARLVCDVMQALWEERKR